MIGERQKAKLSKIAATFGASKMPSGLPIKSIGLKRIRDQERKGMRRMATCPKTSMNIFAQDRAKIMSSILVVIWFGQEGKTADDVYRVVRHVDKVLSNDSLYGSAYWLSNLREILWGLGKHQKVREDI